ncbi:apolipoprotein L1 isoform X2 [Silurus meridionalis]|uniref:apolipoprotein L1 isoform X2 n=1 Tax=Silurus meridionalis TaxID=175797 RepID=UPI001EEC89E4|nr:apolipoprotein L1 isoform X2 [Silurus meridionalis]
MLDVSSDLREMKAGADEAPAVPPRPSEEELRNTITHRLRGDSTHTDHHQDSREDAIKKKKEEEEKMKSKKEDQVVSDECVSQDGAVVQKEKALTKKKKVKKKKNPFMPNITAMSKLIEKRSGEGGEDGEGGTAVTEKTLVEQLNEFHLARVHCQDEEDLDSLMEWWSSVKQWEPMSKDEDMTEKEEAKAFALTAEKVQRGIRVFHQLFSERAETLWQHIIDLNLIADSLDRFNKRTKVVQITGGSTSAVGGVATIAGLALAPVTMGTSLIVTAVGLGVAAAGGLASASAGISNSIHGTLDRRKVEGIVKDFQSKMADIDKCTRFIKLGVENLREFRGPKVKKLKVYDGDLCGTSNIYEDGVMAGKAVLISANEITRFTEATMVTGRTAARAVQVAAMATGILTGLFVAMDLYFVAKDSHELRKGAKSELARKIREVVEQLHEGLVELNIIREELKCSQSSAFSVTSISNPMPSISTSASTHHTSTTSCSFNSGISTSSNTLTSTSISSSLSQKAEAHTEP